MPCWCGKARPTRRYWVSKPLPRRWHAGQGVPLAHRCLFLMRLQRQSAARPISNLHLCCTQSGPQQAQALQGRYAGRHVAAAGAVAMQLVDGLSGRCNNRAGALTGRLMQVFEMGVGIKAREPLPGGVLQAARPWGARHASVCCQWSGRWESNPRYQLGKLKSYH